MTGPRIRSGGIKSAAAQKLDFLENSLADIRGLRKWATSVLYNQSVRLQGRGSGHSDPTASVVTNELQEGVRIAYRNLDKAIVHGVQEILTRYDALNAALIRSDPRHEQEPLAPLDNFKERARQAKKTVPPRELVELRRRKGARERAGGGFGAS